MEKRSLKQFGPFEFDDEERRLWRDRQPVPLTPKAADLLAAFLERPGRLLSKDELLKTLWPDAVVEESNLAYYVSALRKALGDGTDESRYIETVPKRGYRFGASVSAVQRAADEREGDPIAPNPPAHSATAGPPRPVPLPGRSFSLSRRLAIAGLALLAPLLYFGALSWRDVLSADPPRALPLTSVPGVVRSPSLSPDGNYVVFTWTGDKQDNTDLYVHQVGAGGPHQLTSDPGNDFSPSWSPDNLKIRLVGTGAARLLAAGLVLGIAVTAAADRVLRGVLFGVSSVDAGALAAAAAVIAMAAMAAVAAPAIRAARIAPTDALRGE